MAGDYIPTTDAEFLTWTRTFASYVLAHAAALGLSAESTALDDKRSVWETAVDNAAAAQTALRTANQHKNDLRKELEQMIRSAVRRIQAVPTVTDEQRLSMGITVMDTTPTAHLAAPATRPIGVVDTSQRLRHEICFFDEATPRSRAKPAGVMGCEIWVKIGTPPADPSELTFVALDTATPYIAEYAGADAGKVAYYMLRWVSTRSEKGPWSETVAATITG